MDRIKTKKLKRKNFLLNKIIVEISIQGKYFFYKNIYSKNLYIGKKLLLKENNQQKIIENPLVKIVVS